MKKLSFILVMFLSASCSVNTKKYCSEGVSVDITTTPHSISKYKDCTFKIN